MGTKIAHRLKKLLQGIIGLVVLAGLGWGLYTVLQRLAAHLMTLDPNVVTGIIAACSTVLVATLSVLLSKHLESRALVFKEHRDKKVPIYEKLIKFFYETMYQSKEAEPVSEAEMVKFLKGFVEELTVWGSDDVLKAFVDFKRQSSPEVIAQNPENRYLCLRICCLQYGVILATRTRI